MPIQALDVATYPSDPGRCPVTDTELAYARSCRVFVLAQLRLCGCPEMLAGPRGGSVYTWPVRDPGESADAYLDRVLPSAGANSSTPWAVAPNRVPVGRDAMPATERELEACSDSPLAVAIVHVRLRALPDRVAIAPRYAGEDWPRRRSGERTQAYLRRTATAMLGAVYARAAVRLEPEIRYQHHRRLI